MAAKRHGNYLQELKSRSQKKRELNALQDVGQRLLDLSRSEMEAMGLPDELIEAALLARKLRSAKNDAYRRQVQYIGRLMREIDPSPILAHFAGVDASHQDEVQAFQRLEGWRDALLDGDESVLEDIRRSYPQADLSALRETANKARAERELGRPPKFSRQIFRYLRGLEIDAQENQGDANGQGGQAY